MLFVFRPTLMDLLSYLELKAETIVPGILSHNKNIYISIVFAKDETEGSIEDVNVSIRTEIQTGSLHPYLL